MKRIHLRRLRAERDSIERADAISWALLIFGLVRTVAWVVMMVFVALGLIGVASFHWASHVATLVVFVTFISFYANAATDLDQVTAAWAAIRAGRAHAQSVDTEHATRSASEDTLARIESVAELIHDELQRQDR